LQTPQGWGTLRVFVICDGLRQRLYITDIKCDSRELLLVADGVVVVKAAEDHGIQELAAVLNFCKLCIVLQSIWIDGLRTI